MRGRRSAHRGFLLPGAEHSNEHGYYSWIIRVSFTFIRVAPQAKSTNSCASGASRPLFLVQIGAFCLFFWKKKRFSLAIQKKSLTLHPQVCLCVGGPYIIKVEWDQLSSCKEGVSKGVFNVTCLWFLKLRNFESISRRGNAARRLRGWFYTTGSMLYAYVSLCTYVYGVLRDYR